MDKHSGSSSHENKQQHHVVPLSIYYKVWGSLLVLTLITVASSYVDFGGSANILIAMIIATVKALLVILFFMGMKYEGQENNVTFFCSFVFLTIFVGLTSADIFYRPDLTAMKVDASEVVQSGESVDVTKFSKPTPEILAKGQQLFSAQCATCHGPGGHGDGPASAALNPKPRNFTQDVGWKNGRTLSAVFKTVTNGLPGTPMPPFGTLGAEDRLALAHYVRSLGPAAPEVSAEDLAVLQKEAGGASSKPRLSIEKAMDKVASDWEATHKH